VPRKAKPFFWRGGWYTDSGGRRRLLAAGRGSRREAEAELERLRAEQVLDRQRRGQGRRPAIGIKELADLFGADLEVNAPPETVGYYRTYLRYLARKFGNRQVRSVTRHEALGWRNELIKRGYANTTVNHILKTARKLYNWGLDAEVIGGRNPFARIPPLEPKLHRRLLKPEEFATLCEHAGSEDFLDVLVAMRYTPARPADIRRLTWEMVDWARKLWVLPVHKSTRTAKQKAPRLIAFPPAVEEVLRRRLAKRKEGCEWVFTSPGGVAWHPLNLARNFKRARDRAGIGPDVNGEKLVLYTSRHTILTEAVRAGVTGPQLQALGGWTSLAMARHYVHLAESDVYEIGLKAAEAVARQDSTTPKS
jgi:integrase